MVSLHGFANRGTNGDAPTLDAWANAAALDAQANQGAFAASHVNAVITATASSLISASARTDRWADACADSFADGDACADRDADACSDRGLLGMLGRSVVLCGRRRHLLLFGEGSVRQQRLRLAGDGVGMR